MVADLRASFFAARDQFNSIADANAGSTPEVEAAKLVRNAAFVAYADAVEDSGVLPGECLWCGAALTPSVDPKKYCGNTHATTARRARQADAETAAGKTKADRRQFIPEVRECLYCSEKFEATDPEHKHCKPSHARKSSARRKYLKDRGIGPNDCPRPDKLAHDYYSQAERHLARLRNLALEIYECNCGKYHVGHIPLHRLPLDLLEATG